MPLKGDPAVGRVRQPSYLWRSGHNLVETHRPRPAMNTRSFSQVPFEKEFDGEMGAKRVSHSGP